MEYNQIDWNMNKNFYDELHSVRMVKIQAFATGNYSLYIDMLDEIFAMVSFKFNDDEVNELKQMFVKIQDYDDLQHQIKMGYQDMEDLQQYKSLLRDIDVKLMYYMHKHKMVLPKSNYIDPFKEHERKYGLND